jgi:hypothetical protein
VSYLERIKTDLNSDQASGQAVDKIWAQVIDYGDAAIAHAESGVLVNESISKTVLAYYQASQIAPYSSVETTYQELKSVGDLRLIPSDELRSSFVKYYLNFNNLQAAQLLQFVPDYRETIRGVTPWKLQQFIWSKCYRMDRITQYLTDCDLEIDDAAGIALLQKFSGDRKLVRELRFWMTNLSVARGVLAQINEDAGNLLEIVDETLAELR